MRRGAHNVRLQNQRWLESRHPTRRQRRLCARWGCRWTGWFFYSFSTQSISIGFGPNAGPDTVESNSESGERRFCARCREHQYRDVEFHEMRRRPLSVRSYEPPAPWSPDDD